MITLMTVAIAAAAAAAPPAKASRMLVPIGDQAGWFLPSDYPASSIARKAEGVVRFALRIGPDGKPTTCRIIKSGGDAGLDGATCKALLARARFRPLIDRDGKPTSATFDQIVNWTLPGGPAGETSDGTFTAHATIDPTGAIVSCTMTRSAGARVGRGDALCGPFGERSFLAHLMGPDYPKARASDVRLQVSLEGQRAQSLERTPDFFLLLAEAEISIDPDGSMGTCTSVRTLRMPKRSIDLCDVLAGAPPRFRAGPARRRAVFVLDLSASYR